jgi:membrane dipeptidase
MRTRILLAAALAVFAGTAPLAAQADSAALLARARRLHAQYPLVDGHNDLPWEIRVRGASDVVRMSPDGPLPQNNTDVDRLRQGGVGGVFWAAYVPVETMGHAPGPARVALEQIDLIHRMVERSPSMEMALTADDVVRIHHAHKVAALIGIEGGHAIENSLGALRQFYGMGVRYMTLTHTSTIDWADAATDRETHGGLTRFGEEVVREMNRLGMLVDLSHVSARTMNAVLDLSQAPVIFSHSSAFALDPHPRNVPDDVLRRLPKNGGVVMVSFVPGFISDEVRRYSAEESAATERFKVLHSGNPEAAKAALAAWRTANPAPRATLAQVADHIDHVRKLAGIDAVGLGSDFDGITTTIQGLEGVETYPALLAELLRRGYSDEDVRKVAGKNLLRVMRQAEATANRLQKERLAEDPPAEAEKPVAGDSK